MSDLYGQYEQSREKAWAVKQDAHALEKLRERAHAEQEMSENMAKWKAPRS